MEDVVLCWIWDSDTQVRLCFIAWNSDIQGRPRNSDILGRPTIGIGTSKWWELDSGMVTPRVRGHWNCDIQCWWFWNGDIQKIIWIVTSDKYDMIECSIWMCVMYIIWMLLFKWFVLNLDCHEFMEKVLHWFGTEWFREEICIVFMGIDMWNGYHFSGLVLSDKMVS